MIQARRLAYAALDTPDLLRLSEYYQNLIGLRVAAQDSGRVLLMNEVGQVSIVLERGPIAQCKALGFEISPEADLLEVSRAYGQASTRSEIRNDVLPGIHQSLSVTDPNGTEIILFSSQPFAERTGHGVGVGPNKLGHIAFYTKDVRSTADFYDAHFGFRVSDWIEDYFVFMRCGLDHHAVNFIQSTSAKMHHIAFELRDASHLHRACDLLGQERIPLLWGPVRHGPGHNVAVYHRCPDGQLVEFFIDLDRMVDEELGYFEPRPWHRDRPQRPQVWRVKPRDIWGLPPAHGVPEFAGARPE
jgi:catechol-2,3-dioxygenase